MKLNLEKQEYPKEILEWLKKQDSKQQKHIGTHIDTYKNTYIDFDTSKISTLIVDVMGEEEIGIDTVKNISLEETEFIIFRTGYMEKYGYGSRKYFHDRPLPKLTFDLVDYLIDKGIKFIGIDLHGIMHGSEHKKIDIYCEEKNVYVIENICNLDKVNTAFHSRLSFIQDKDATAIPVSIAVL